MSDFLTENNAWAIPLPDDWQYYRLSDLISFYVDNRGKTAPTDDTGIPLIATNCIKNENLYPTYEKVRYVSQETYDEWFRAHPEPNDIIIVNKGTPGLTNLVPDPVDFVIAQDMMAVRANDKIVYPYYLFATLRSPHFLAQVNALTVGTTIPHLKKGDFDKLIIPIPPYPQQKEIGDLYINFSKKIEANRQMNETLEAIASSIYKSWFVDFDPVSYKLRGEVLPGIDMSVAELFPNSLEKSEFGLIPNGWEITALTEQAEVIMGQSPPSDTYNEEGIGTPLVNGPAEFGEYFIETYKWTNQPTRLSAPHDLILCVRGSTTGRTNISDDKYCLGRGVCAIRSVKNQQEFINQGIAFNLQRLLSHTTGSVFPNLSSQTIREFKLLQPDDLLINAYCQIVRPSIQQVWENNMQSRILSQTRDAILPRLLNGDVQL